MKAIELTKKQQDKLLEMCEKFFKDEDHSLFRINLDGELLWVNKKADINKIHWFEFCMRFLVIKLDDLYFEKVINPVDPQHFSNKNKNLKHPDNWIYLWDARPFIGWNSNCNGNVPKMHPIHWLYEQFKKLTAKK